MQKWMLRLKMPSLIVVIFSLAIVLALGSVWGFAKLLGSPNLAVRQTTLYYADNGEIIGETSNGQKRFWVKLEDVSPKMIDAVLAVEDRNFYRHHGFDFKRIGGAALADLRSMQMVQGASTISQQYARNLFLGREKTWQRKLREAFYTLRIEANYSKNEILEGYLNTIYFGHGQYGVQAASQYYFHKDAADLDWAEATMLAGIPKGPGIYSPLVSRERAKARQEVVLAALVKNGTMTVKKRKTIAQKPLDFYGKNSEKTQTIAPYFQDTVRREVRRLLGMAGVDTIQDGLRVYTTLSLAAQTNAEDAVRTMLPTQSKLQTAVISMDPQSGAVKALIGGRDYASSPFNRAVQSLRQPGSTIKPILYYAALEKGFTPSTTMRSERTTFTYDDGRRQYSPQNFKNRYANRDITLAQALALSDNVYAVKTHLFLGENELERACKRFGLHTKMQPLPSVALGTFGVRPIELANAYNFFANEGRKVSPTFVTKITNFKGEVLYEKNLFSKQTLSPENAFVLSEMMKGIFDKKLNGYAPVTGASIAGKLTHDYAGKSGTTATDSWMIGYTPELTTAVWVGYDSGRKLVALSEQRYAKNIWAKIMEEDLRAIPVAEMKVPKNVVAVKIDPESGLLAGENCPNKRLTYFIAGTEPTKFCEQHGKASVQPKEKAPSKEKQPWYRSILRIFR